MLAPCGGGVGRGVVVGAQDLSANCYPHPHPLPTRASMSTDLCMRFGLAEEESGVILFLPSRFGGLGDGGDGYRVFRRPAPKKNGAQLLARVCERQTIGLRKLGDDR